MMIKKSLILVCALMLFGCSYGKEYLENADAFIRDPHFTEYKRNRDDLERSYLHKEITYAEYIEQKGRMDETYAKEVQERGDKVIAPE